MAPRSLSRVFAVFESILNYSTWLASACCHGASCKAPVLWSMPRFVPRSKRLLAGRKSVEQYRGPAFVTSVYAGMHHVLWMGLTAWGQPGEHNRGSHVGDRSDRGAASRTRAPGCFPLECHEADVTKPATAPQKRCIFRQRRQQPAARGKSTASGSDAGDRGDGPGGCDTAGN